MRDSQAALLLLFRAAAVSLIGWNLLETYKLRAEVTELRVLLEKGLALGSREIGSLVPPTQPRESVPRPTSHRAGHFLLQIPQQSSTSDTPIAPVIPLSASWVRVETDIPCDVFVNGINVLERDIPEPADLVTSGTELDPPVFQVPASVVYRGRVESLQVVPQSKALGVGGRNFIGLAHVWYGSGNVAEMGPGRPVEHCVSGSHLMTATTVRSELHLTDLVANSFDVHEALVRSVGVRHLSAAGISILEVAIQRRTTAGAFLEDLWRAPLLRVWFDMGGGAGFSAHAPAGDTLPIEPPLRIPVASYLREAGPDAWPLWIETVTDAPSALEELFWRVNFSQVG